MIETLLVASRKLGRAAVITAPAARLLLLGLLACTVPGCGDDNGAAADGGPRIDATADAGPPDASTCSWVDSADAGTIAGDTPVDRLVGGFCSGMSRCGSISSDWGNVAAELADPVLCRERAVRMARLYPGLPFPEFERAGYELVPETAQSCAERLSSSCPYNDLRRMAGPGYDDPCEQMLQPLSPVEAGGDCRATGDCANDLVCAQWEGPYGWSCGWQCQPPIALGDPCETPESCADPPGCEFAACIYVPANGARCGRGHFAAPADEGEPCGALISQDGTAVTYVGCRDGLLCSMEPVDYDPFSDSTKAVAWTSGVCRSANEPGGACDSGLCPLGTACECNDGVFGTRYCGCTTALDAFAAQGESCAGAGCDAPAALVCTGGTCETTPEPGAEGDRCQSSVLCHYPVGTAGAPQRFYASPEPVESTPECRDWTTCGTGLYCRYGTCAPQLADGEACDPNADSCATGNCGCLSGYCEYPGTCAPRPTCN